MFHVDQTNGALSLPRGTASRARSWASLPQGRLKLTPAEFDQYVARDAADRFECQVWRLLNMSRDSREWWLSELSKKKHPPELIDRLERAVRQQFEDFVNELVALPTDAARGSWLKHLESEGDAGLAQQLRRATWARVIDAEPMSAYAQGELI